MVGDIYTLSEESQSISGASMSIFDKIFRRKSNVLSELKTSLNGVDFKAAAENIAYTFREAERKAQAEGGHAIMKKEFIASAERYMQNPCLESAIVLLNEYPSFYQMFEFTKDPLQAWARDFKKTHQS